MSGDLVKLKNRRENVLMLCLRQDFVFLGHISLPKVYANNRSQPAVNIQTFTISGNDLDSGAIDMAVLQPENPQLLASWYIVNQNVSILPEIYVQVAIYVIKMLLMLNAVIAADPIAGVGHSLPETNSFLTPKQRVKKNVFFLVIDFSISSPSHLLTTN